MKIHIFQNKENKQTKNYNNLKYFLFLFLNYIFNVREIFIYLMVICHFVEKKSLKPTKTQYLQFREHDTYILDFLDFGFKISDMLIYHLYYLLSQCIFIYLSLALLIMLGFDLFSGTFAQPL